MTQTQQAAPPPGPGGDIGHRIAMAGAVARVAMGGVFIIAGLTKVWDPILFYWEAISYAEVIGLGRELWPALGRLAVGLGPLEAALGLALVVNWRPRFALPTAIVFTVAFLGLTGMAWQGGSDMDCGCFGALVKRTPLQAFLEDLVMLGLLGLAWRRGQDRWPAKPSAGLLQGAALAVLLSLATTAFRFYPESGRLESSDLQAGVRLTGLALKGVDISLSRGEYLVELFNPRCSRCRRSVPKLNHWVDARGLPPVVGITMASQESSDLAQFRQQLRPRYPIASVSVADWRRLTWRHGYPRLAHVRDGVIERVWEHDAIPSTKQLRAAIAGG